MKNILKILVLISFVLFSFGCSNSINPNLKPLEVVTNVDVNKYMGKWYEIANIPIEQQLGCVGTTATYTLRANGEVDVLNECRENTLDGKYKRAEGRAWVVDKDTNAKLKVTFFLFFAGDYWVIDLDKDYKYAVVGVPSRNYVWILSRTKTMDDITYQQIVKKISEQGYDITKLIKTPQDVK